MNLGRRWTWGWSTGDAPEGRCADGGATAFVDSRTAVQGRHSLRLTTPTELGGVVIVPYEVPVAAAHRYLLSVWCRASPGAEPQRVRPTPIQPRHNSMQQLTRALAAGGDAAE